MRVVYSFKILFWNNCHIVSQKLNTFSQDALFAGSVNPDIKYLPDAISNKTKLQTTAASHNGQSFWYIANR